MTDKLSTPDRWIAELARRQHGVVTAAQMVESGIDRDGISWRVRTGRLHRLHRGVYAVGHRSLSWRGRWMAAVLAAGDGAVLSHTGAAALWRFLRPIPGPVHVTLGAAVRRRQRPGLQYQRSRTLTRHDITHRHGIAVTTPARTITDIRTTVDPHLFRRASVRPSSPATASRTSPRRSARARTSSSSSSPSAPTTTSRRPSSTTASTDTASTSSSPTTASWSRPTAGSTTAGRSPSRRITRATSRSVPTGSRPGATPGTSRRRLPMPSSPTCGLI